MTSEKNRRRLRLSGVLLIVGLLLQVVTLFWSHPTAFVVFLLGGGTFVAAGLAVYVWVSVTY